MSKAAASPVSAKTPAAARAIPKHLWQCNDFDAQCRWVAARLHEGMTLTDPGIYLGGADPDKVIRKLRGGGLEIKTVRKRVVDAADEAHMSIAWRLYREGEPRPAPRKRAVAA